MDSTPLTPQEVADLRAAKPEWAKSGLMIRQPEFSKSKYERSETQRTQFPPTPKQERSDHVLLDDDEAIVCCFFPISCGTSDIPDTLTGFAVGPGGGSFTLTAASGEYTGTSPIAGEISLVSGTSIDDSTGAWAFIDGYENLPDTYGQWSNCLIGAYNLVEPEEPAIFVFDNFLSTYHANGVLITRTISNDITYPDPVFGSCQWEGTGFTLDYGISNACSWSLNGTAKTGSQNTPIGTYGSVGTVA